LSLRFREGVPSSEGLATLVIVPDVLAVVEAIVTVEVDALFHHRTVGTNARVHVLPLILVEVEIGGPEALGDQFVGVDVDNRDNQHVAEVPEGESAGVVDETVQGFEEYFDHHVGCDEFAGVVESGEQHLRLPLSRPRRRPQPVGEDVVVLEALSDHLFMYDSLILLGQESEDVLDFLGGVEAVHGTRLDQLLQFEVVQLARV